MVKLLIVDDEPKLRSMLSGCLEPLSLEIATAQSGEEALQQITAPVPPQLVIMDIKMPGMGGLKALQQIKATAAQIGVFLLTGYDDDAIEQQAIQLGALGVLHKPLVLADIRQAVQQAIAKLPPAP